MKKTKVMTLMATTTLGALALVPMSALAVDGGEYQTNGAIQFAPNTNPTNPVDPTGPAGPLSIDYASSLSFGEQTITSKNMTYYAETQKYKDNAGADQEGPNFVQVSDNRGTETGWTLKVKQNGQFKTEANQELTAAKVTLSNGRVVSASQSAKPTTAPATIELNPTGAESVVMAAGDKEGAGTYLMSWGDSVDTAKTSISLEVPGSTTKYAKKYTTTFTWTLTDTPANTGN
ncbi:WxL domain-containing protein [Enterococcus faecalis]|uniref:WxL domain-containing protein n=1 Tax=Enterococcus faecalis TaxID=1351 RepID=UPI000FF884C8|nr:WxL domain-containing protein [Enterococcus faecalis]RXA18795.1 WxL domain-containing protein [Enterococcus faecalis]RXA86885.1 WxL domain-containing protein [Enterococcus faecalis]RXA90516.1 WxL domain-containing protein [Enterococcus faecalis]